MKLTDVCHQDQLGIVSLRISERIYYYYYVFEVMFNTNPDNPDKPLMVVSERHIQYLSLLLNYLKY